MLRRLQLFIHALRWYRTRSAIHDAAQSLHGRSSAYVISAVVVLDGRPTVCTMDAGSIEDKVEMYEAIHEWTGSLLRRHRQQNP